MFGGMGLVAPEYITIQSSAEMWNNLINAYTFDGAGLDGYPNSAIIARPRIGGDFIIEWELALAHGPDSQIQHYDYSIGVMTEAELGKFSPYHPNAGFPDMVDSWWIQCNTFDNTSAQTMAGNSPEITLQPGAHHYRLSRTGNTIRVDAGSTNFIWSNVYDGPVYLAVGVRNSRTNVSSLSITGLMGGHI